MERLKDVTQIERDRLDAEKTRVTECVRKAFNDRRHVIVGHLARVFYKELQSQLPNADRQSVKGDGWSPIQSLSQLRSVVGGRFQNLKQKWVDAGFPLREHRGDREGRAALNSDGWLELSVWINRQGFETRLARGEEDWLFEIRANPEK
jgi:hypothetical protein